MKHTNHQAVIQHSSSGQLQFADFIPQRNSRNYRSPRGSQTAAQGNWINDMNPCLSWKTSLPVTSQHIQCRPRDQIGIGNQWNLVGTLPLICYHAIEWRLCRFGLDLNPQFQPYGQGKTNDIEAWPDVRRRTWHFCTLRGQLL